MFFEAGGVQLSRVEACLLLAAWFPTSHEPFAVATMNACPSAPLTPPHPTLHAPQRPI